MIRNGTYLRESDGATRLYHSPYSFNDAEANFRKRHLYDDGWHMVVDPVEQADLHELANLTPGEWVFVSGGRVI
jgi:hypothetical protein